MPRFPGEVDPDWDPTVPALYNREVIFCGHCGETGVDRNLRGHVHLPMPYHGYPPNGIPPKHFQIVREFIPVRPYRYDTENTDAVLHGSEGEGHPRKGSGEVLQDPREGLPVPDRNDD